MAKAGGVEKATVHPQVLYSLTEVSLMLLGKLKTILDFSRGQVKGGDSQLNIPSSSIGSQTTHLDFSPLHANKFQIHLRGLVFRHFCR